MKVLKYELKIGSKVTLPDRRVGVVTNNYIEVEVRTDPFESTETISVPVSDIEIWIDF